MTCVYTGACVLVRHRAHAHVELIEERKEQQILNVWAIIKYVVRKETKREIKRGHKQ